MCARWCTRLRGDLAGQPAIKAHQRQLQAREFGQTLADNPGQAEGTDNGGGDPAAEGVAVGPGPVGFLQDVLDWVGDLF